MKTFVTECRPVITWKIDWLEVSHMDSQKSYSTWSDYMNLGALGAFVLLLFNWLNWRNLHKVSNHFHAWKVSILLQSIFVCARLWFSWWCYTFQRNWIYYNHIIIFTEQCCYVLRIRQENIETATNLKLMWLNEQFFQMTLVPCEAIS